MTKSKKATADAAVNPVVLWYVGEEGGGLTDTPATDLTTKALERLVYVRTYDLGKGLYPGDPGYDAAWESVVARLVLSGFYDPKKPRATRQPDEVETAAEPTSEGNP